MGQVGLIRLKKPFTVLSFATVAGKKESEGPFGGIFDITDKTDRFGADTWEKAESEMQRSALIGAMEKAGLGTDDIDALFAGDLLNQCTGSTFGLLDFDIPFFGIFGACSTLAEGIILSALALEGGQLRRCAVTSSSHNCSAERQYRFPLEYGGQRTPTAQWTVTGAGAYILDAGAGKGPYVSDVMGGIVKDSKIKDSANMGAAMAPAAADTLCRYFKATDTAATDYDKIITGDLGFEGSSLFAELMSFEGYDISAVHEDCGKLIYDRKRQDVHSGGSGCGCCAVILGPHFLKKVEKGELGSILFMATGALMNPASIQQGNSIPAVAHLVRFCHGINQEGSL